MRGVIQIVRFNWPFYAMSIAALACAIVIVPRIPIAALRLPMAVAAGCAAFWTVGSLLVSFVVYDRSGLTSWNWITRVLPAHRSTWINIHAGLDESTPALTAMLGSGGRVFDIFDAVEMTEPSIARARRLARNVVAAEPIDYHHLPLPPASVDSAFLFLAAHELRSDRSRTALFEELRRVLAQQGRIIVAEHLRDWANFLAFGPGFLHFHARRTWLRSFRHARLAVDAEFSITPFVRVFVLRRAA